VRYLLLKFLDCDLTLRFQILGIEKEVLPVASC
jgi:hypothetical protein